MIQTLSDRYRQPIAATLSLFILVQGLLPLCGYSQIMDVPSYAGRSMGNYAMPRAIGNAVLHPQSLYSARRSGYTAATALVDMPVATTSRSSAMDIGGPASPEASSFKAVGSNNLVNLFTGDFSYSIPLLDVDGYPVNLFYNGGITMDQEASWVGLGWNINPGSVSRNMRGVPDDFDGTDMLKQTQNVKPNETWGGAVGIDGEAFGIKAPNLNFNLGFSYNNYLGPELDLGAGISVSIASLKTVLNEKSAPQDTTQGLSLSFGASAKLSSRSGLTLSPSLNANLPLLGHKLDLGVGISTSYNGRTGMRELTTYSQRSAFVATNTKDANPPTVRSSPIDLSANTISFARASYVPTLRMPMLNTYKGAQLEAGAGMFGFRGAGTLQGYYIKSEVASQTLFKPLVGYMYLEKANGRKDAVMDFNRLNDQEVTPHTPIVSAPQYDYDIFTVQGEGTGGSIRAYRGDLGFMRDPETQSQDKNGSIGFDIAPPGHYGGNINLVSSPTRSGNWDDINNTLNQNLQFKSNQNNSSFEHVYFRNPGEATVTNDSMISKIGRDNLVRFQLDGSSVSPRLESQLEQFDKHSGEYLGVKNVDTANLHQPRDKRTQVITMLTASDASRIGLDDSLRSYQSSLDSANDLTYTSMPRVGGYRQGHHISEVTVLEPTGMRYVYGLPVYNTVQRDFTFSVGGTGDPVTNLVNYVSNEPTPNSDHINGSTGIDGYTTIQETPAYASAFLITGLLSPDYVDVTGNGITEDDLGSAVKFDYTMSNSLHRWRTPRTDSSNVLAGGNLAYFNAGLRSEKRDNKATISYGEREAWYLHSIESKSMIAIFSTSARKDAKGVMSDLDGSIDTAEKANQKLDSISLYTKADLKAHGLAGALPLKTIHFDYSYALCDGTPDNAAGGKLTLTDIYFTFNGQSRASKDQYVFNYGNLASQKDNAGYAYSASDRWGTYKPAFDSLGHAVNPNSLNNIDYPYTSYNKTVDDPFAGEWALKKILLPSGGQMEMQYEADDYAYVQNKRACNMFPIYGLGSSTNYSTGAQLYTIYNNQDQNYAYIQLPAPLVNTDPAKIKQEILAKYLDGIKQMAFKLNVIMPGGMEPLTVYAGITDYGLCTNSTDRTIIYVQLTPVDGKGPLANASVQFLINSLPGQAFPGYDLSGGTAISDFLNLVTDELNGLANAFKNAEQQVRSAGLGSTISLANSFVRVDNPTFFKYGGGYRVKRITLKDNWNPMTHQYNSQYGQDYDYTTTANVNGVPTVISSGVASYEPGIGSEENPFREILQFEDLMPLASAQYGAIEMPMLEGLFPAPVVGYSQVTVRSINRKGAFGDSTIRSAIGKQVTEFYTAREFPTYYTYTPMSDMDYHHTPPFTFFSKETVDHRTLSQGFLVETNDMHGKMKRQAAYSESDENTPLSYTLHTYKNTGANGLNDQVDFVHKDQGSTVVSGNIGIDVELMTDSREFDAISSGTDWQGQIDFFTFVPWPIFGLFVYPLESYTENKYQAVTTTKLINYHAIEDSVIVNDRGSVISTKTIAYDAETGSPLVTATANEFKDPVYNINYPAWWAYSGMGPSYQNIGAQFGGVNFSNGQIVSGVTDMSVFESGDELLVTGGSGQPNCVNESPATNKIWVYDTDKDSGSLTIPAASRNLVFMDSAGRFFTKANASFRIVRSGHRNNLSATVTTATTMVSPIRTVGSARQLKLDSADNVVAASAVAFKEKWQTDRDALFRTTYTCETGELPDCSGTLPTHINPYTRGLEGNFKPYRSYVYYGSRVDTSTAVNTRIRRNGYIQGFGNYWGFDGNNDLVPDVSNTKWVWNTEVTKVNAKGQELETRDALNRYTSAQYGFAKNLPVAMVQNARSGLAFEEGFEDYGYSESLNNSPMNSCDSNRYISFNGLANSSVFNTDTSQVKAHSGRYLLKVNPNAQAVKSLYVNTNVLDSFNYDFRKDTLPILENPGGNVDTISCIPRFELGPGFDADAAVLEGLSFSNGCSASLTTGLQDTAISNLGETDLEHTFNMQTSQYMQITQGGTYTLSLAISDDVGGATASGAAALNIIVTDLNGNVISSPSINVVNGGSTSSNFPRVLCVGIYKVEAVLFNNYERTVSGTVVPGTHPVAFSYSINSSSGTFKTADKVDCLVTDPAPATDSMLNRKFALVPGEKMQFSAWVREDCGNAPGTPCYTTNYVKDHVTLQFPGSTDTAITLRPAGPLIEGWQRIDGAFTVPSNATMANLVLSNDNTSSLNVYFDDIRMHPFNADMKGYVYDPRTLRLSAESDENNYSTFYNYDEEGQLVRVKKETIQGIKTIREVRTGMQKSVKTPQ